MVRALTLCLLALLSACGDDDVAAPADAAPPDAWVWPDAAIRFWDTVGAAQGNASLEVAGGALTMTLVDPAPNQTLSVLQDGLTAPFSVSFAYHGLAAPAGGMFLQMVVTTAGGGNLFASNGHLEAGAYAVGAATDLGGGALDVNELSASAGTFTISYDGTSFTATSTPASGTAATVTVAAAAAGACTVGVQLGTTLDTPSSGTARAVIDEFVVSSGGGVTADPFDEDHLIR
jgi:hypothetical protein